MSKREQIVRGHRLLGLFLLLPLLLSCGPAASPLRVAINAWPGYEFLFLAEHQGLFERAGVAVDVVEFDSLSDARRAFERGQVDGFGCTVVEALISAASGQRDVVIPHVADYSNGADQIIAQHPIRSVADLAGRRVAVEAGTVSVYLLARALEGAGLGLEDVTVVKMPQTRIAPALDAGTIDAAVSYPPFSLDLLARPDRINIFDSRQLPGEVLDVLAFDRSVLLQRGAEVRRLLHAFDQAIGYAEANPDLAHAIMAERQGIDPAEFRKIIENDIITLRTANQPEYVRDGKLRDILTRSARVLQQTGDLRHPAKVDAIPFWRSASP